MRTHTLVPALALLLAGFLNMNPVFASSGNKPNRSDNDITAIGHRNIGGGKGLGNWYSLDQENAIGKHLSAEVEKSSKLLDDPAITEYVTRIAENISKNSDAQIPITVRLIDSEHVEAFTLPGGSQYITRGLLLQLENENELASVLARGIAHTALRSSTRLMTHEQYANIGAVPLIFTGDPRLSSDNSRFGIPMMMLKFRRGYEAAADYFGVQYVYKAGYSTEGFPKIVQKIWPATTKAEPLSLFPPTSERLQALQKEITELLPKRDGEIISTPEFQEFSQRLRSWKSSESVEISK